MRARMRFQKACEEEVAVIEDFTEASWRLYFKEILFVGRRRVHTNEVVMICTPSPKPFSGDTKACTHKCDRKASAVSSLGSATSFLLAERCEAILLQRLISPSLWTSNKTTWISSVTLGAYESLDLFPVIARSFFFSFFLISSGVQREAEDEDCLFVCQ